VTADGFGTRHRAAELREAFDRAFAAPPAGAAPETVGLLLVWVGAAPYALRVSDLSGLVRRRKVAPLPGGRVELLGVAGIRGSLVSVYGLAALLGHATAPLETPWLALSASPDPVALAFEELEGFLRVEAAELFGANTAGLARNHVREVVRVGKTTRGVIDARGAVLALKVGAGKSGTAKEQ
jgi:purine-binding chemotaxis protein CheW